MIHPEGKQLAEALERLLGSETFRRSPALGRLLAYLVERVLAGEAGSLKEAVIGHELYGRPVTYDPKLDSVVRVSANRLRLRLEDHYRAHPDDKLRIVLPRGSYVPLLESVQATSVVPESLPPLSAALVPVAEVELTTIPVPVSGPRQSKHSITRTPQGSLHTGRPAERWSPSSRSPSPCSFWAFRFGGTSGQAPRRPPSRPGV